MPTESLPFSEILDLVSRGGALAIFVIVLVTGYYQKWVWGWHHRQVIEDRDFYRQKMFEKITAMEAMALDQKRQKGRSDQ